MPKRTVATLQFGNYESDYICDVVKKIPALIGVYSIRTGQYSFVNDAVTKLLGYSKKDFLAGGLAFSSSLVHPDDLPIITKQSQLAIKRANRADFLLTKDLVPVSFEYRMRHKKGKWVWLHSDGVIFSRDSKGKVEWVMNVSVDITKRKEQELAEQQARSAAEEAQQQLHRQQLRFVSIRAEIADILRKELPLEKLIEECLKVIIKSLPATFSRLWLLDEDRQYLNLMASAGTHPPNASIRSRLKVGEFAVGLVAENQKPYITNNIYQNNHFHIQNIEWAQRKKLKSFAGYPLFFHKHLIGVLAIFANYDLTEDTFVILSSIADIFAQEIERRKIEVKLNESRERYRAFISQSSEGIWRFELEKPISIHASVAKQINHFYKYAYLAECNDATAKMYGFKKAEEIVGARLPQFLVRDNPANINYLKAFIESGYNLTESESVEIDREGNQVFFVNNLVGIIQDDRMLRAWGIQRDVTEWKLYEEKISRLSAQKDEFIAIASHELKTPVTTLKAYTQILANRFRQRVETDTDTINFLDRMDMQLNKLTHLIGDLLDVSKIESGKLEFTKTCFSFNDLVTEIVEQMQQTTLVHKILLHLDKDALVEADRDRISQVLINFLSNAIKYSPKANKIEVSTKLNHQIEVDVTDFGLGISKDEQVKVFERFYRTTNPKAESFPGLGLGLYICAEIIRRHNGEIGVSSRKNKGSTFFFSLPVVTKEKK